MKIARSTLSRLLICIASLQALSSAVADERVRPRETNVAEGYQRVSYDELSIASGPAQPYPAHALEWPVAFLDGDHTLGNVMAQYQPFDEPPYFHGGIDIRVSLDSPVRAPVSGWLEAGHYSYSTRPDGGMDKYWKPWPQTGSATYFEVAVVTADNVRFEMHHMDRSRLPADIVSKLDSGRAWIEAGTPLGYAVYFSPDYNHVHYNVVLRDGTRVNPEFISSLVPDTEAPRVLASAALLSTGEAIDLSRPHALDASRVTEFILATYDSLGRGPYRHPPTVSELVFEQSGQRTAWDFSETLTDQNGRFPDLAAVFYRGPFHFPDGQTHSTDGGYGDGTSVIRLKVPQGAQGPYRIELRDAAGNKTRLCGSLN